MSRIKRIEGSSRYYITVDGRVLCSRPVKNQFGETGWKRFWKALRVQNSGYTITDIMIDSRQRTKTIHRLVALAFVNNPENKSDVNHKDGKKGNNNVSNLEWMTKSENSKHSYETGLHIISDEAKERIRKIGSAPTSEKSKKLLSLGRVGITIDKAIEIRSHYREGRDSIKQTAKKFSVSISTTQRCIHNTFKCWDLDKKE